MATLSVPGVAPSRESELVRQLGLVDTMSTVVGTIIGSGIFVVPSIVLATVKDPTVALAAWLVGGVLSLFGTLTLAELGAVRPQTGGIYVYLRDAYGPIVGFLYGWTTFWVMQTGTIAAVSVVFGTYMVRLLGAPSAAATFVALGAIWLLTVVNMIGVRRGAAVQNIFAAAKFLALVALVALSFSLVRSGATHYDVTAVLPGAGTDWSAVGTALVGILFAYEGWTFVTFIGGEVKDPQRTLPRALVLGMTMVVAIYVLTNVAYLRVLAPAQLAQSSQAAADVAVRLVGRNGATLITCAILASTFGAANGCILTGARSYFAMARDHLFFRTLGRVHPRFGTPAASLIAQATWCSVLVLSGSYTQLITYVIFTAWIFYALTAGAVFVFRRRYEHTGGYRTMGYPFTTVAFILAATALVLNTLIQSPREALIGLALMLAGLPAYLYWRRVEGQIERL